VRIGVKYKDQATGKEFKTENRRVESSNELVASASLNEDGSELLVVSGTDEGEALITVKADPKIGAAEAEITGVLTVVVSDGEANTVELTPGTPEPKP